MKGLAVTLFALGLMAAGMQTAQGGMVTLNFNDVAPGTLTVFSPYQSQGFTLTSSSGGFVFNSPDTGNGIPQTPGNNPFYARANGLAAFSPATITLTQTNGNPFALESIDLARNFAFDPAPSVTFAGTLAGGGTVTESFTVTTPSPPNTFQTFNFTGFGDVTSVSWDQGNGTQGIHQFTNIVLDTNPAVATPEPSTLTLLGIGSLGLLGYGWRRRSRFAT